MKLAAGACRLCRGGLGSAGAASPAELIAAMHPEKCEPPVHLVVPALD